MSEEVIVLVTCPQKAAKAIAEQLVEANLVACVNIIPTITSIYKWQEKLTIDEDESLMIAKSSLSRWAELEAKIREIHSYEVPEIICVPIIEGHTPYLDWLNRAVSLQNKGERQTR